MTPFIVAGESLVDIVVRHDGSTTRTAGGSPLNVAVGLTRLDVPSLLITRFGDDQDGDLIKEHLRSSGVLLSPEASVTAAATSTATAHLDGEHAATYDFDLHWDLAHTNLPDDVLGLHVGSLGTWLSPGRASVRDLVSQASERDAFVSYDPNVRPRLIDDPERAWQHMREIAAHAHLVKVSDEDLHAVRPDSSISDLAHELLIGAATELVLVTAGPHGASAFSAGSEVHAGCLPVTVVDTVGAGDAFMAGVLAVLVDWHLTTAGPGTLAALGEDHVRTLLNGALTTAAVVCGRSGANPPKRQELPTTWPS